MYNRAGRDEFLTASLTLWIIYNKLSIKCYRFFYRWGRLVFTTKKGMVFFLFIFFLMDFTHQLDTSFFYIKLILFYPLGTFSIRKIIFIISRFFKLTINCYTIDETVLATYPLNKLHMLK